jgi:hypothetical protein
LQVLKLKVQHYTEEARKDLVKNYIKSRANLLHEQHISNLKLTLRSTIEDQAAADKEEESSKTTDFEQTACSICMSKYKPKDRVAVLQCNNNHYFHLKCALNWFKRSTQCPLCRVDFTKQITAHKKQYTNEHHEAMISEMNVQII